MIKLINGDCLVEMKNIQDNSIDLILCDLPYGETGNSWDKKIDLNKLIKEYIRIIKEDGCIALNCTFKFAVELYNSMPEYYKYDIVWAKDNGTNVPNVNYQPFRVHELILIFSKSGASNSSSILMKYNPQKTIGNPYKQKSGKISSNWKYKLSNIITYNNGDRHPLTIQYWCRDKNKLHSTQKPLKMYEWLIKTYTNENDLVLDNCMGSGTSGVACVINNRNYIGIELNNNYYEIAKKRIENCTNIKNSSLVS